MPMLADFASKSFAIGGGVSIGTGGAVVAAAGITITGTQILVTAGVAIAGVFGVMLARTGSSNGYFVDKFSRDHSPDHAHLRGPKTNIKIDINGNPLEKGNLV
jgi:hypothetical protein